MTNVAAGCHGRFSEALTLQQYVENHTLGDPFNDCTRKIWATSNQINLGIDWLLVSEPGFWGRRTKSLKNTVFKAFRGLRTVPES